MSTNIQAEPPVMEMPIEPTPIAIKEEEGSSTAARRSWLKLAIKLGVSAAILAWILSQVALGDILTALQSVRWPYLAAAFALQFVGAYITVMRWRLLLNTQGARLPLRFLYGSWLVGCFFKQLLPSVIGADAVRVYDSHRAGATKSAALAVVGVDRVVGLLALLFIAVIALCFATELTANIPALGLWVAFGTLGMATLTWLIFFRSGQMVTLCRTAGRLVPTKVATRAERIFKAVAAYDKQHGTLALALMWSLLLQLAVVTFYFLIALAMGFDIPFVAFMLIVPIAIVMMMIPVTINGIGVREAMHVLLLGTFGVTSPQAIAFAWLEFGILLAFGLVGGVVYLVRSDRWLTGAQGCRDSQTA